RNPATVHRLLPAPGWISMAPSSPASRPFVLAALRALRLDPGCGCRAPKTRRKRQKNGHNNPKPALTSSAASGMTPEVIDTRPGCTDLRGKRRSGRALQSIREGNRGSERLQLPTKWTCHAREARFDRAPRLDRPRLAPAL